MCLAFNSFPSRSSLSEAFLHTVFWIAVGGLCILREQKVDCKGTRTLALWKRLTIESSFINTSSQEHVRNLVFLHRYSQQSSNLNHPAMTSSHHLAFTLLTALKCNDQNCSSYVGFAPSRGVSLSLERSDPSERSDHYVGAQNRVTRLCMAAGSASNF